MAKMSTLPNRDAKSIRDTLKKEIVGVIKKMKETQQKMLQLEQEKKGLDLNNEELRAKLVAQCGKTDVMKQEREDAMNEIWETDADTINDACKNFGGADKDALVDVIFCRTGWQLAIVSDFFEDKYGSTMNKALEQAFKSMIIGKSSLCRMILLRAMEPSIRDATLLREYSDGITLDDDHLIEILSTRSNNELRLAFGEYERLFKKDFLQLVTQKLALNPIGGNYKTFILQVLELKRDEENKPYDPQKAKPIAEQLWTAGGAKVLGCDTDVFVKLLGNINHVQFDSINDVYNGNQLMKDVERKLGGNLRDIVVARCTEKYDYLAKRLFKEKDSIPRIFGSLTHAQCRSLREAYDRMDLGMKLEDKLDYEFGMQATLNRNLPYLKACLNLISNDHTSNPLGNNNSLEEDDKQGAAEGARALKEAAMRYDKKAMASKGRKIVEDEGSAYDNITRIPKDAGDLFLAVNSNAKLFATLKEYDTSLSDLIKSATELSDSITSQKEMNFELIRMTAESAELGILPAVFFSSLSFSLNKILLYLLFTLLCRSHLSGYDQSLDRVYKT